MRTSAALMQAACSPRPSTSPATATPRRILILGWRKLPAILHGLNAIELPPFRSAIAAGVDSVMVAHVTVPALEPDPNRVASTSPAVVTDLLKHQLGFEGLVVTDALDMAGLTHLYANNIGRAAVDAFKAGNDVLIIPADLDASWKAMLQAVRTGEIPQSQLDASVLKILKAKASLGLNQARRVDLNQLTTSIGTPEDLALGQRIADDAITLVRDNGKILPLKKSGTTGPRLPYQKMPEVQNHLVVVILTDDVRTESGRELEREYACVCRMCMRSTLIQESPRQCLATCSRLWTTRKLWSPPSM